jgi:2-polyprenyl-6-methoxyphenol hydroxylase-like FAD-dependent oxidoreductase
LMTPFAGVGVNAAMLDALELARSLNGLKDGSGLSLDQALQSYENQMYSVSRKYAEKTMKNLNSHFSENGGLNLARRLTLLHGYLWLKRCVKSVIPWM